MIRLLSCLALFAFSLGIAGCGTSTKELAPNLKPMEIDQEKINKAIEDSKSRMPPGYPRNQQPQQPGAGT